MKVMIVYYSMSGNTEKVARALAASLESGGVLGGFGLVRGKPWGFDEERKL
jgi:hypothetical protein